MSTPNDVNQRCQRLLEAARKHGVCWHLSPMTNPAFPDGQLKIWNSRTAEGEKIVEVMRNHREELITFLRAHRPAPLTLAFEEAAYRDAINPGDDIPVSELTVGELKAVFVSWYLDMRAMEEMENNLQSAFRAAVQS